MSDSETIEGLTTAYRLAISDGDTHLCSGGVLAVRRYGVVSVYGDVYSEGPSNNSAVTFHAEDLLWQQSVEEVRRLAEEAGVPEAASVSGP